MSSGSGSERRPTTDGGRRRPPPPRPRVLVADASRERRIFLSCLLERWGYKALHAIDGPSALRMLRFSGSRRLPVLLVCHEELPGLSGPNLLLTAARDPELTELRAVLYTGEFFDSFPDLHSQLKEHLPQLDPLPETLAPPRPR